MVTWCPIQNLGPIGLAVLTFIGYKQTDKPNLYIEFVIQKYYGDSKTFKLSLKSFVFWDTLSFLRIGFISWYFLGPEDLEYKPSWFNTYRGNGRTNSRQEHLYYIWFIVFFQWYFMMNGYTYTSSLSWNIQHFSYDIWLC